MPDLLLLGSNIGLGAGTVRLSESRRSLAAVDDGKVFPRGVRGLIPVESTRKSGAAKVAYALPLGEQGSAWSVRDAVFTKHGQGDDAEQLPTEEPEGLVDEELDPAVCGEVYDALLDAVDAINEMLDDAVELSGHRFGYLDAVRIGVPWRGAGYTRAVLRPLDDKGGPSPTPLHLVVETSIDPGSPGSLTSTLRYDRTGHIQNMLLTEYGEDGYWCRVEASINYRTHRMGVYKVEEYDGRHPDGRLLYKRGYTDR